MGAFEIVSQTKKFTRCRTSLDRMLFIHLNFKRNFLKGPDKCGSSSLDGRNVCFYLVRIWWPAALLFGMMSGYVGPLPRYVGPLPLWLVLLNDRLNGGAQDFPNQRHLRHALSHLAFRTEVADAEHLCPGPMSWPHSPHFLSWNSHKLNLRWRFQCLRRRKIPEELLHDENWSPWGSAL